jgi:hypothetical protein
METLRYVGMDVHKETIVIMMLNGQGKVVMEGILETKALTVRCQEQDSALLWDGSLPDCFTLAVRAASWPPANLACSIL